MNMEKCKNIAQEMKLNNYFIDDNKEITFWYFYENIISKFSLTESDTLVEYNINFNNYIINIIKRNTIFCDLNLLNNSKIVLKRYVRVFNEPIKLYYNLEKIELAFLAQFDQIPGLLNLKFPILLCYNHNQKINYNIRKLIKHFQAHKNGFNQCKIEINENSDEFENSEIRFNQFFKKIKDTNEFETPIDFDINYEDYFDFYKYQVNDKKFQFLDDKYCSRDLLVSDLCCYQSLLGYFRIYFGKTGMGKSITLIKTFKYSYNHDSFGTLYIHCKSLYNYFKNNFQRMKKILKDEIIFLFKNEYEIYKKCLSFIDNSKNNNNFFDLIIKIITNFCKNESKHYIFIFDQYKTEYDPGKCLDNLNKSLIKNNNNYGLIACCSMDNKSVRELKVKNLSNNLFKEQDYAKESDNIIIEEIDEVFDISKFTIDNGGIFDKTLDKIGKTLKNYIALKEFSRKKSFTEMENYVNDLEEKITINLKDFFKLNKKIKEENDDSELINLNHILSFTVDTDYNIDFLKEKKNLIPFKYFDIQLNKKDENLAKIIVNYELVGEVMNKIYEDIIYENNNIYQIFDRLNLDQGALGRLYEKYVIHFMEPDKYTHERKLFNLFNIKETVVVDKFVPTSKEKYFERKFKIRSLKEGDYLFKQKQFAGKAFDTAILRAKKNGEIEVFFFQISFNKETLYSLDKLNLFIETFIQYFRQQFDFKIKQNNVYFTYIFHTKNQDELYQACKDKDLKCIFFNPSIQIFTDENNIEIDEIADINNIFINPFILFGKDKDIEMKDLTNKKLLKDITQPNFILNDKQKKRLKKLWKNLFEEFKNSDIEISFSHITRFIDEKYLSNKIFYLRELNKNEFGDWIDSIIENEKDEEIIEEKNVLLIFRKENNLSFRIISEDGEIYSIKYIPIKTKGDVKNYDVYFVKILLNN